MLDSHCHLNDSSYEDYKEEIFKAQKSGVNTLLIVGWDLESSKKALQIAHEFENVYATVGIHPENIDDSKEEDLLEILNLAKDPKVLAIGEIGLDYHWFKESTQRQKQNEWFIKQIKIANELNLPISVHSREAIQDTFDILKEHPVLRKGVLHCYSGSKEMMGNFIKLGFYFGFDGPITFKNSKEPKECVQFCPLNRLLSETDSPYLTPVPFRGNRNSPSLIPYIVKAMSEIKNISIDEIEKNIEENFNKLFHGERHD